MSDLLRIELSATSGDASEVHVAPGAFDRLAELAADRLPAHRYAVIADETVEALYGAAAIERLAATGREARLFAFPAGERHKTRATWADLTDRLLGWGLGRDGAIVALGGGVTGDLAGFVAATYLRGVPYASVPTTLLAMLDSSVGGKTGVDTTGAKNVVGAFHHPRFVVVDPSFLRTLPERHLRAGLAEGVKTAAIRDAALFARLESEAEALASADPEAVARLIRSCLAIKAEVVAEDPRETGRRAILNFGHTAGHALEVLSGFELLHGEAVAAGLVLEAGVGERLGVTGSGTAARLRGLLAALGLESVLPPGGLARTPGEAPDAADLLAVAARDKKGRDGIVRWVLLARIGEVARDAEGAWTHAAPPEEIARALGDALRREADVRDSAS